MTHSKDSTRRGLYSTLLLVICTCILLSGCTSKPQSGAQGTKEAPAADSSASTGANSNNSVNNPKHQQDGTAAISDTEGLPSGVKVKRVIKDITLKNNYHKKIELLTDGGKRVTITDANGGLVLLNLEYEGIISQVSGKEVTVQVDHGTQQTITIPDNVTIEDDDNLGLNKGVEIEWTIDGEGNIQNVELDD
ncbi:hypothetical protein [Paenibacillus fonticola]|uniref:hypothetical protein n=1 Tax=Paenibacillus fonticola TaxID=379896 RepID=UPI0012FCA541|nr:hypothetical protein [Paenibacillus fonticola]